MFHLFSLTVTKFAVYSKTNWGVRKSMLRIKYVTIFIFCFNVFRTLTINHIKKYCNKLFFVPRHQERILKFIFFLSDIPLKILIF